MPVSEMLEKAIEKVSHLSTEEQDALAEIMLQEMESEKRWDEAFKNSQDQLAKLGEEALKELREGRTKPLDPEKL